MITGRGSGVATFGPLKAARSEELENRLA